jgi:hypothetical protein
MMGFAQTAVRLQSPVHQQSLSSAERSVIELWIDMELLHRDVVPEGVEKILAFVDVQKLKARYAPGGFWLSRPRSNPSASASH